MSGPKTKELEVAATSLDAALRQVEQRCQEMRWRLENFPAEVAVKDMEDEIDAFAVEVFQVARLYGEMSMLAEV